MEIEALAKRIGGIRDLEARKKSLMMMLKYVRMNKKASDESERKRDIEKRELCQNIRRKILKNLPAQLLKMKVKEFKENFGSSINFHLLNIDAGEEEKGGSDNLSEGNNLVKRVTELSFGEIEKFQGEFFSSEETPKKTFKRIKGFKLASSCLKSDRAISDVM